MGQRREKRIDRVVLGAQPCAPLDDSPSVTAALDSYSMPSLKAFRSLKPQPQFVPSIQLLAI